jgi:eukaryotic-like serine/threonine-protein kinase
LAVGFSDTSSAQPFGGSPFRRGDAIDRFTVLEQLGAGGMGVVVSAYDVTLDRKVAIKVLRPDRLAIEPDQGRTRLLREAQAMARLSHPNVITVHEVGTVGEQVFVAMELVDGHTLAGWLAAAPRTWREVTDAFVRAGRGLAAAHRVGLVHRDFKPDNVLVGAGGEVRVTDFGLASVSADSTAFDAATVLAVPLTRTGAVMGTPAYMSPEQHRSEEADARSDQFSFCVALYEALYGVRPFAGETGAEVLEAIESRRVRAPEREAPRWLRPLVLRGLEPRPEDRWPSMETLLEDLSRDPAATRRRRLLWAGGVGAAAALAAAWFLASDRPALCQGAPARAASVWNAGARGKVRSAFLATGSPIAADVFSRVDRALSGRLDGWAAAHTEACRATHERGEQSSAMLDLRMRCLERARREMASLVDLWTRDPVDLETAIDAAASVGDAAQCADTEALAMPVAPPRDPDSARRIEQVRAQLDAIEAHRRSGRLTVGLELARKATAAARPLGHPPILAEALHRNGRLECEAGKIAVGAPLLQEAAATAALARDDVLFARILTDLLEALGGDGERLAEASTVSTFAEAATARAGHRDELVAALLRGQAVLMATRGKNEESLARLERARPLLERVLGRDHPEVAGLSMTAANQLKALGRVDEGVALLREALAIHERTSGPEHPRVAFTLNNLANALAHKGDHEEALVHAARSLAIREKVYPAGHPQIARGLHTLALIKAELGLHGEARAFYERAEAIRVAALGPEHPDTAMTRENLAGLAIARRDMPAARRLLDSVRAAKTRAYGEDHPRLAHTWRNLGLTFAAEENWKAADEAFSRAVAIRRKQKGDPPELSDVLADLGNARSGLGRHGEAIALLQEALAIDERVRGGRSVYRSGILIYLGEAYLGAGRNALAVATLEKGITRAEVEPNQAPYLPTMRFSLARALWATGARARAVALARAADRDLVDPKFARERGRIRSWVRARRR